jgi:hypothetical protein
MSIEETDEGIAAVFGSIRTITVREPVAKEDLPDDAAKLFEGYQEIVGVRHIRQQAIDVVSIPTNGDYINVRVDYPEGMHRDVGEAAQSQTRVLFSKLINKDILTAPVNLFPLVNLMYSARSEGVVVELAFGTTTASWKHEKMRRRANCLRDEAYHKGGKQALSAPIEPYRLSIVWKRKMEEVESKPELNLHGSSLLAGAHGAVLSDAVIRKCMGSDDFLFVESRIEHYLSKLKKGTV